MRVCFSVGAKSPKAISLMSQSVDNVEFFSYASISEMIKESTMRQIFFDRIVFSEKILKNPEQDLRELNNYISEHSDNTKIVFVCKQDSADISEKFMDMFNSPLYTSVLAGKITTSILIEFVKSDIAELKAKYYMLDISNAKANSSNSTTIQGGSDTSLEEHSKQEKVGFFKSLFGGKKNFTKKSGIQNVTEDITSSAMKVAENVGKNSLENAVSSVSSVVSSTVDTVASSVEVKNDLEEISNFKDTSLSSVDQQEFSSEFSYNGLEEDNLGIGDLGKQHVDTGFLDDEAESEINSILQSMEEESDFTFNSASEKDDEVVETVEESILVPEVISNLDEALHLGIFEEDSKFKVLIRERDKSYISSIFNYFKSLSNSGKRVLIVDLDTVNNEILTHVDTSFSHCRECIRGIDNLKVYSENGIGILSNGYDVGVSNGSLDRLSSSGIFNDYDIVFIDCPIDCVSLLNSNYILGYDVVIRVNGNRGSLLSMLGKLTSRKYISSNIEDMLFEKANFDIVNKEETFLNDIEFVKNYCLFGRGDWASKLK